MSYETSGQLFRDLIRESLEDSSIKALIDQAATQLGSYLKETYWDSKDLLLSKLESFHYVLAKESYLITVGERLTIQEVITRLSKHIDGDYDFIEKIQVSTWVVESMVPVLFKLTREGNDGQIYVQSIFTLDEEESLAKGYVMYPPPETGEMLETGGKTLGSHFNLQNGNKAMDVIEILQSIEWVIDPYIAEMEEEPNKIEFETIQEERNWIDHKLQSKKLRDSLEGKVFRFYSDFCKRGRIYMRGYHVTFNGIKYKAAVMDFKESYTVDPSLPI